MHRLIVTTAVCAASCILATYAASAGDASASSQRTADRDVAWIVVANESVVEREMNAQAALGMRLAAVTDGLPCQVAIMQTPAMLGGGNASYRLVVDRDLIQSLPNLASEGFEPRGGVRRPGGRTHVVWERSAAAGNARVAEWRAIEFSNPDALEKDLAETVQAGFRPRSLARTAFRSWPGLSEKGLIIAGRRADAKPRDVRVLRGTSRNVDELTKSVEALTSEGWSLDLAFTSSRDGNPNTRRERAYLVFSREVGTRAAEPLRLTRSSSWGMVGDGEPVAAAPYWNDFLFAWKPAPRRQIWATPIRLTSFEASCGGLAMKLRIDGQRDQRSTIVAAIARPVQGTDGYELVLVLDERLGS